MLADAPTDVLVYLVDNGSQSFEVLTANVPPTGADDGFVSVGRALRLLTELGLATLTNQAWRATAAGIEAVARARVDLRGEQR